MPLIGRGVDLEPIREDAGIYTIGRAVTATLRVSPNGNNIDGSSWTKAYRTVQAALDAASTNENDCTLIIISPQTNYNINMAGDPTWSANVIIAGTHRNWAKIKNTHPDATSILKLTGSSGVIDLSFDLGNKSANGLIMTANGFRIDRCIFEGKDLTGEAVALWIDGNTAKFGKIRDCDINGHIEHMTGILLDNASECEASGSHIHSCLTGIQIVNSFSDSNLFSFLDICNCALGLDIDAGDGQRLRDIRFFNCTVNVDDEVGDHSWVNIDGEFNITIDPDNLTGVQIDTGAANTFGADTEIRAAVTSTKPFRIVAVLVEPLTEAWYQVRFSADSGSTFYDIAQFYYTKREGAAAPSGTEHIFNKGTRISASARNLSGGDNVKVWLEIQEI